jgi:hypothetical protein
VNESRVAEQPAGSFGCGVMSRVDRNKVDRDQITEEREPKCTVGFAASPVLPGESQEEFDCLFDDLCEHYEPKGPVEEDAVCNMADAIWRKRHLNIFQRAFEARMRWGSYLIFPGDPNGFTRIMMETRDRAAAMMVQATTAFAMKRVEQELGKADAHSTEKMEESARFAQSETEVAKNTKVNTASNNIPEGLLKRIVETAAVEIETTSTEHDSALNAKHKTDIVKRVMIEQWEREIATDKNEKPCSIREEIDQLYGAFDHTMDAVKTLLGADAVEEILEKISRTHIEQSLAKFGDLLSPERYIEELKFRESLGLDIERSHDRLMKYQSARGKNAAANISSLQPAWAARKR